MKIVHYADCENVIIDKFPYKGKDNDVVGTSIRWLSKDGDDGHGYPEYGLRYFTIQPGGYIPIHNHFYQQTMYILEGRFECWCFDSESDEIIEKTMATSGDAVYIPSMEPHGMKNIGETPATFLCCICNVYEDKETA
jgi:quercetin dioxygenase-like cupin family protein